MSLQEDGASLSAKGGKPSRARVEAWRYGALLIGLATNFFGGTVYVFPNYTLALINDTHINNGQAVNAGVICHFGLAVVSFPFGLFYFNNKRISDRMKDIIMSIACLGPQAVALFGLALLDKYWCKTGARNCGLPHMIEETGTIVWLLYLLYGFGVGAGFGHCIWVSGHNFSSNSKAKSAVVSSISLAMGLGSLFFVAIYPDTFGKRDLSDFYFFQGGAYIVVGILRITLMRRLTEAELGVLASPDASDVEDEGPSAFTKNEIADLTIGSGSAFGLSFRNSSTPRFRGSPTQRLLSEKSPLMTNPSGSLRRPLVKASLQNVTYSPSYEMTKSRKIPKDKNQAPNLNDDNSSDSGFVAVIEMKEEEKENPNDGTCIAHCGVLCCSPIVYLTFITAFVGIGLGGTFESMIGFLCTSFVPSDSTLGELRGDPTYEAQKTVEKLTTISVLLFLAFQVLARILATIIVKLKKWQSYLFILWLTTELIGMGFIWLLPLVEWAFMLGSALIGFGFGGNLSTLTAHVAVHFPGGKGTFPFNLGLALLAPGLGNLAIGSIESLMDDAPCSVSHGVMPGYANCAAHSECVWFNNSLNGYVDDPKFGIPNDFFNVSFQPQDVCVQRCKLARTNTDNYIGGLDPRNFKFWLLCYFRTYTVFMSLTVLAFVCSIVNVIFVLKDERRKKALGIVDDCDVVGGH